MVGGGGGGGGSVEEGVSISGPECEVGCEAPCVARCCVRRDNPGLLPGPAESQGK